MKTKRILGLSFLLILILPVFTSAQSFPFIKDKRVQEIKLLQSTDKDIDRIFGRHIAYNEPIKVKDGVVIIRYSFGKCNESDVSDWNVAQNVVVGIDFNLTKEIKVESTKLNFDGWRLSFESMHNLPLYSYSNDEEGIKYVIDKGDTPTGIIHSVEYCPSSKSNHLRCSRIKVS